MLALPLSSRTFFTNSRRGFLKICPPALLKLLVFSLCGAGLGRELSELCTQTAHLEARRGHFSALTGHEACVRLGCGWVPREGQKDASVPQELWDGAASAPGGSVGIAVCVNREVHFLCAGRAMPRFTASYLPMWPLAQAPAARARGRQGPGAAGQPAVVLPWPGVRATADPPGREGVQPVSGNLL